MTYDIDPLQSVIETLSDPTRRAVLDLVRAGVSTAGEIAKHVPVSRPAVSQHLKALLDAHIVLVRIDGTRRRYSLRPEGFSPLQSYLNDMWDQALDEFSAYVETYAEKRDGEPK
ncbi:MAG: metalloregulator ArsR/SmtB family transcription factor [Pseudomonadota bacterium]